MKRQLSVVLALCIGIAIGFTVGVFRTHGREQQDRIPPEASREADTREHPGAPGDSLIIVAYDPPLPATLDVGERLSVTIDYTINSVEQARIWARPFTQGRRTSGYGAHPSSVYKKGEGRLVGWFRFSRPTIVDEVRVRMVANQTDEEVISVEERIKAQWVETR